MELTGTDRPVIVEHEDCFSCCSHNQVSPRPGAHSILDAEGHCSVLNETSDIVKFSNGVRFNGL